MFRIRCVVDDHAFVVFRTIIHDVTERIYIRKESSETRIEFLDILFGIVLVDKYVIYIRTDGGRHVLDILESHTQEYIEMTSVHEQVPHRFLLENFRIETQIIQDYKHTGVGNFPQLHLFLPFHNIVYDIRVIITVYERIGDDLGIRRITVFRSGHSDTAWNVSMVPENVEQTNTFSCHLIPSGSIVAHPRLESFPSMGDS